MDRGASRGAEDAVGKGVVLDLLAVDQHHSLRSTSQNLNCN